MIKKFKLFLTKKNNCSPGSFQSQAWEFHHKVLLFNMGCLLWYMNFSLSPHKFFWKLNCKQTKKSYCWQKLWDCMWLLQVVVRGSSGQAEVTVGEVGDHTAACTLHPGRSSSHHGPDQCTLYPHPCRPRLQQAASCHHMDWHPSHDRIIWQTHLPGSSYLLNPHLWHCLSSIL